jgi:putative tricarboxylic transport membrane protein
VFDLSSVLSLTNIMFNLAGVTIGIIFGAIPGLTATMGVALFLPFTFGMETIASFALLLGIYVGGIYGGSVTAILIRTPGTPASAATVLDGYPLAEQGKAFEALSMATIASFIGGIFSCIVLIMLAPQLARVALSFGPAEYFAVGLFGLSIVATLSSGNMLKGFLAALLGLLISTIGMDPVTGTVRFTFNSVNLTGGVDFVSALIGMFAVAEVFSKLEKIYNVEDMSGLKKVKGKVVSLKILVANSVNLLRSSVIGTVIGIIPATGSGVASWLAYNEAKRASKEPENFGKGAFEGVAASEAANNAVTGGALVPLLTLGIPGDVVTAVMLGALMIQGLTPGPLLFRDNAEVVTGIYVMLILSNVFMLLLGLLGINAFVKILKVPANILMPIVLVLCFIGAYAINNRVSDVALALFMGIVGYLFTKVDIPVPPMLLGIILAPIIEANLRRALIISQNDWGTFFTRPVSLLFIVISIFSFLWPLIRQQYQKYKEGSVSA